MTQIFNRRVFIAAVAAFVFPIAARADLSDTKTLTAAQSLNLDTGSTASPDILWTGNSLAPQGSAKAVILPGITGATAFGLLAQVQLQAFSVLASSSAIPTGALTVGAIVAVFTNAGHPAKMMVTANSGGSITLQFTTYAATGGGGGGGGAPTITQIVNNSSSILVGFPGYGIAPSSLFAIKGSGLADPGDATNHSSEGAGLQTTLNGASVSVTVSGTTTHPALYYATPSQLSVVLPAATPLGTGTLTVTYKGVTSAPATIKVVPSAVGINSYNGNFGVATDAFTGALLTVTNSGTPGQTITLWITGLGADPADSDTTYTLTPHSVNTPLQIYFGGILATILYQGASTYTGVSIVNLTIPESVPTGCFVPLAAVTGVVVSNVVTFPIHQGGGPCVDARTGLTGAQLTPTGGQTLKTGLVALIQTNDPKNGLANVTDAAFEKYTGIYAPANSVSPGGCIVNLTPSTVGTIDGLDPGTITLTGPGGLAVTLGSQFGIKGAFFALLGAGAIPSSGGTFTFKGSGGADVGSFTSALTLSNPLITWTNQGAVASVDRTQGLTVAWTGGNPGTYVYITGGSGTAGTTGSFTCLAPVDAGQFTVPSYILLSLPAGNGSVGIQNIIFSPLSAAGLDIGSGTASIGQTAAASYR